MRRLLSATPRQLGVIDKVLEGWSPEETKGSESSLLMAMGEGARFLGLSRPTFWRLRKSGRLPVVEIMPGVFRVSRRDLEAIANGRKYEAR